MTQSILRDGEAVSPRTVPSVTPHDHTQLDKLTMATTEDRSPGFRLLDMVDRHLVPEGEAPELLFSVRTPSRAHGFEMWTRFGHREHVSQETFMAQYKPESRVVAMPAPVEEEVLTAWEEDKDVQATLDWVLSRFAMEVDLTAAGPEVQSR